ncbi:uncharacterized protein KY384_003592 [Bacidia gigantensis]|uniref:uncharacterized protein n=1 Tax=Bacidia gigantensis TaxID=2732470 RepID=UPI001D04AF7D|nr:uncharacterized protein KY384_003592 [Bacidia gigantensis]KAG8531956.1 hypothetical protein KY384_003592 [Bacidia gigantensis]
MVGLGNILPKFDYQPLENDKSVRLLALQHGDKQSAIICDLIEVDPDKKKTIEYEAVSWTWDSKEKPDSIRVNVKGKANVLNISHNLFLALKALRLEGEVRYLWSDAICVNQDDPNEKNHQIPMMPSIYGDATQVCVWLGEADKDSDDAIAFIERIMQNIWKLDTLCEAREETKNWAALLRFIMKPWFSRRWIVQEIALAKKGTIYCGQKQLSWRKFSDAVSSFVEVETATHRLSEIMRREAFVGFIPDFFANVAVLSATLLIETTNTLFRRRADGQKEDLLSLEYLVSRLSIFATSEPPDAIYALLAIARHTQPVSATGRSIKDDNPLAIPGLSAALGRNLRAKEFRVNYDQPYVDTCKNFVDFSIRQSEPSRALDIICRPWAPPPKSKGKGRQKSQNTEQLPSWIRSVKDAAFKVHETPTGEKIGRINGDPLVGLPTAGQRNYTAAETKELDLNKLRFAKRSQHYSMYVEGFKLDEIDRVEEIARGGNLPETWLEAVEYENEESHDPPEELWRTIVANRGPEGRNPPGFYTTAFKEALKKGMHAGALDTADIIYNGRCSIVAQFLRRVQEVIWNRRLMHTKGDTSNPRFPSKLGLVHKDARSGDLICILYGCTIPVVLRKIEKSQDQIAKERREEVQYRKMEAERAVSRLREVRQDRRKQREVTKKALRQLQSDRGLSHVDKTSAAHYHKQYMAKMGLSKIGLQKRDVRNAVKDNNNVNNNINGNDDVHISDHYYVLVGECYVHGMMDNEAIAYQNARRIPAETLELR